jgi:LysM repeat protein
MALVLLLSSATSAVAGWHVVAPGETLWLIGEQYGIDAAEIAEVNGIQDPNLIHIGDELWIPVDEGEAPPTGGEAVIHVVESGDTVASIAALYGVDTTVLASINGIESPYLIYPGQELVIPYAELPVQPTPSQPSVPDTINPEVPYFNAETVKGIVIDLSQAYGWDPYLILSLAWRESTWDQRAISPSGAVGVMQLMPSTADWAGPALVGRETDYVYSAWDNIETGIAYLSHLRALAGSDYLALAGYFQGLASVERDGIFPATRDYALGIIESRDLFASGALP